jgi:ferric-dicitrate binding protein FerR (iron transport regulator)
MQEVRFHALLEQYITDMINKEDFQELRSLLEDPHYRDLLEKAMENEWNTGMYEEPMEERMGQLIEQNVLQKIEEQGIVSIKQSPVRWMRRIAAAAALIVLLAGSYYFLSDRSNKGNERVTGATGKENDIRPGSNKAVLVLSDGRQINLETLPNGLIANQGSTMVTKKQQGLVTYEASSNAGIGYRNTLITPKGGQYHLRLVDGTDVWLNAASSMRFPAAFDSKERKVEITGEAYFEVAHDATKPFRVESRGMQVEVLGTHFNINAYENESELRTTLLQGKIKIIKGKRNEVLSPGEQARISTDHVKVVKNADTEEAIAWKNGIFQFRDADVKTVMRQVERWYDVEAVFEGTHSKGHFNGTIPRNIVASKLVQILNAGGIQCRIEGRKIIVQ